MIFRIIATRPLSVYEAGVSVSKKRLRAAALTLGQQIAALRRGVGMTQEVLAEKVSSTKATISRLETGRELASVHRLIEIADALGVELSAIFGAVVTASDPGEVQIAEIASMLRGQPEEVAVRAAEIVRALVK